MKTLDVDPELLKRLDGLSAKITEAEEGAAIARAAYCDARKDLDDANARVDAAISACDGVLEKMKLPRGFTILGDKWVVECVSPGDYRVLPIAGVVPQPEA